MNSGAYWLMSASKKCRNSTRRSLPEWNEMRMKLLETEGTFDLAIGSVSARSAELSLRHPGGTDGLAQALATQGLTLTNNLGIWLVRSTF